MQEQLLSLQHFVAGFRHVTSSNWQTTEVCFSPIFTLFSNRGPSDSGDELTGSQKESRSFGFLCSFCVVTSTTCPAASDSK